ncbi:MAG: helix-turn-helix domain-containing protein [Actinobacteria bacterium]|nr:helix-turn-helix domain-containing protein [Actinomycetota bacterium]
MTSKRDVNLEKLLENEQAQSEEFRAEWLRLAPARQFATMLVGYRADHDLSQRELAAMLGVSQPRIARMESGEQNPDFETIIAAVAALGTEFMLDVAPAGTETRLVTKAARAEGSAVTHRDVAVVTAASPTQLVKR